MKVVNCVCGELSHLQAQISRGLGIDFEITIC